MPKCDGNLEDHCCYINGGICQFLEENTVPGRRWACALRREYGSWQKVHESDSYLTHIHPFMRPGTSCGDWPPPGEKCAVCGVGGDG